MHLRATWLRLALCGLTAACSPGIHRPEDTGGESGVDTGVEPFDAGSLFTDASVPDGEPDVILIEDVEDLDAVTPSDGGDGGDGGVRTDARVGCTASTCTAPSPCQRAACRDGGCVISRVADGTRCGSTRGGRCCAGACRDISTDERNCGGCGLDCSTSPARTCEPLASGESGRCLCMATAECPRTQICRNITPNAWRCGAIADTSCATGEKRIVVSGAADYCAYPN